MEHEGDRAVMEFVFWWFAFTVIISLIVMVIVFLGAVSSADFFDSLRNRNGSKEVPMDGLLDDTVDEDK